MPTVCFGAPKTIRGNFKSFLWSKFGSFLTIKIGSKNEDNAQLKMPAALSKSMVQKL